MSGIPGGAAPLCPIPGGAVPGGRREAANFFDDIPGGRHFFRGMPHRWCPIPGGAVPGGAQDAEDTMIVTTQLINSHPCVFTTA